MNKQPFELKPFDLLDAMTGKPIVTRKGKPVKFVAYVPKAKEKFRLVVMIDNTIRTRYANGTFYGCDDIPSLYSDVDLFMCD